VSETPIDEDLMKYSSVVLLLFCACGPPVDGGSNSADAGSAAAGAVTLQFSHEIQGQPMAIDGTAALEDGSPLTVTKLRYWFSNLVLVGDGIDDYSLQDSYFLIEQTRDNSRLRLDLEGVPAGTYSGLRFSVGVDADHNHSLDSLAGELSAGVDMSWSWSSGFIFLKAEGEVGLNSGGFEKSFSFHVGRDETYRNVELTQPFVVTASATPELRLRAEVTTLFHDINRANNLSVLGGTVAETIADNYGSMWTIEVAN
jgi:hypothetical protein